MKSPARIAIATALALLCTADVKAGDLLSHIDIRAGTLGTTTAAIGSAANPAGLATAGRRMASAGYINRFGIKELSSYSGLIHLPTRALDFTLCAARFGMDAYNENKVSLTLARRLKERFALGVRVNYYLRQLADRQNNVHALTADLGMSITATDKLTIGIVINNPLRKGIVKGKTDEKLPVSAAVGVSYQPLSTLLLTVEVEKSTDTQLWFKAAGEYSPIPLLDLRMGVYGAPFSPTFGVGLNLSSFTVHAGAMWHTDLGPSVMCGLDYTF